MSITIGLVGHGRWGKNIERTLRLFPEVEVVLIERGQQDVDVDGVMIATPSATHAEIVLPYIEKGIPAFIEKPLSTSISDAEAIQTAAVAHTTFVQVGHIHTHNPALLAMREILPQLGAINLATFEHLYNLPRTDSSVFWDCLPHTLSIAYTLFGGEPSEVRAWSLSKAPEGLTEVGVAMFRCGHTTVFSHMNWRSPEKKTTLTLFGEKGSLVWNDMAPERKLALYTDSAVSYPSYDMTPPLTCEVEYFLNAIREHRTSDPSLEMGVRIVEDIERAETSAVDE